MSVHLVIDNANPRPPVDLSVFVQHPEPHDDHWHEEAAAKRVAEFFGVRVVWFVVGFVACLVLFGVGGLVVGWLR